MDTKLRLHDTVYWVGITLSKSLKLHADKKVFKIGDIVEVVTTKGGPDNLHTCGELAVPIVVVFMVWCRMVWYGVPQVKLVCDVRLQPLRASILHSNPTPLNPPSGVSEGRTSLI